MPLFKKRQNQSRMPTDDNKQRISESTRPVDSPRARASFPSQPPFSPTITNAPHSPALQYSPCISTPRSILRNRTSLAPELQDMSQSSHATLLLASSANTNGLGPFQFLPSSNSTPALYPKAVADLRASVKTIDGLPASISLPHIDPRALMFQNGAISPRDTSMTPRLSASPFVPLQDSHASLTSKAELCAIPSINTPQHRIAPPFPFPSEAAALHTLARVLRTETQKFRITDFIDLEEGEFAALVEARHADLAGDSSDDGEVTRNARRKSMWDGEEEDETVTDCVRDMMEDDGGDPSRWKAERTERSEKRRKEREMRLKDLHLFGTHLEDLPDFALVSVTMGGYRHEVPSVVGACIEELIRSRLKNPNFFHSRPDRKNLFDLVTRFDHVVRANAWQGQTSLPPPLRDQTTPSVYALLGTYLSALPHTLIPRPLVDALWCWCVSPSMIRQAQRSRLRHPDDDEASESEREGSGDEDEDAPCYSSRLRQRERDFLDLPSFRVQIRVARHVLLLLSRRQFSLLIYLMNFIRAVLDPNGDSDEEDGDRTSKGVGLHDVARRFGGIIVGGKDWKRRGSIKRTNAEVEVFNAKDRDRTTKEHKVMTWLVNHWGRIASAYESGETTSNVAEEHARPRAASLPAVAQTSYTRLSKSVPPRTQAVHEPAVYNEGQRPSDCGSMTSESTASSSELEEIPLVSSRNTQVTRETHFEKPTNGYKTSLDIENAPSGEENVADDIFDYYCGRDGASQGSPPLEQTDDPSFDDDVSVYSCDEVVIACPQGPRADSACPSDIPKPQQASEPSFKEADGLRLQLEQALRERDEARKLVDAMRTVVKDAKI